MIENLIAAAPFGTDAWFYRTRAGAEIDLLLQLPDRQVWAIEIKRSTAPRAARGLNSPPPISGRRSGLWSIPAASRFHYPGPRLRSR